DGDSARRTHHRIDDTRWSRRQYSASRYADSGIVADIRSQADRRRSGATRAWRMDDGDTRAVRDATNRQHPQLLLATDVLTDRHRVATRHRAAVAASCCSYYASAHLRTGADTRAGSGDADIGIERVTH